MQQWIGGLSIVLMTILVVADIAGREVFGSGISWGQKLAVYLMIWAGFIGAGITNHKGGHLRPEIADKIWPEKFHPLFHRLRHLVSAIFAILAFYYSILYVNESITMGDKSPVMNIYLWIVQLVIPFTFAGLMIQNMAFVLFPSLMPPSTRQGH